MKDKDQYELGEAIRRFHETAPLKMDLATIVAKRAFRQQEVKTFVPDKWLYVSLVVLVLSGIIFSLGRISLFSVPAIILTILVIAGYAGLSVKEYSALAKRLSV